ncbi:hypothetical protein IVB27_32540 [Bradyrhizobium sp. 197]|uniref:hypothetical protein n=1 Tax=Bradyrhizobium sp. 197 TaxID=2782663 RepID=UPI001FF7EF94|nr:hypothetical protein [Bradyrhizobium sp. 197]MCK1479344.1 hypothetical protein [Bradyrhizobium sp. 197]
MPSYGGLARNERNILVSGGTPVVVPADFVGMHANGLVWDSTIADFLSTSLHPYPPSGPSPTPSIGYGAFRLHEITARWDWIETSAGVYNWSYLDQAITREKALGHTVSFCPHDTPLFYLSAGNPLRSTSHPSAAYPDNTSPNGLTGWSNFITAVFTRYNTPDGGWSGYATYGRGIDELEYWNEPGFVNPGPYYQNNVNTFVDLCKAASDAVLAVDPTVKRLSAGFVSTASLNSFLPAVGTLNPGVTGKSLCDVICIHYYGIAPPCQTLGVWGTGITADILSAFKQVRNSMTSNGIGNLPLMCSETGLDGSYPTAETTIFASMTTQQRYQWLGRLMLIAACLGYQRWMVYGWDLPFLNYPMNDLSGTAAAINDVHVNVAGKTVKSAYYDVGGVVTLQFTDGSTFAI